MKTVNSFAMPRSEYLSEENDCRCSKYVKEVQRDFPCINITLHSDSKMRSNQYRQKEITLNENKPVLRNTDDLSKTYSGATRVSPFDLPNRRYDHTGLNIQNHFHLSQPFETQYERKYDRGNEVRIPHTSTPLSPYHSICTNEIPNIDKTLTNPVKRKLTYSKYNGVSLNQPMMLRKETMRSSHIDDKIATSINTSMHQNENPMRACCKELSLKTLPTAKLGNSMGVVSESRKAAIRFKTDLSPKLDKVDEAKEDSSETQQTGLKTSLKATIEMKKDPVIFTGTDFKLNSTNTVPNSELRTVESLPQSASYRPFKEYSRISSLKASYVNNDLIESKEFENTVCTNQLPHIYAKSVSDKNTLDAKKFKDLSGQKSIDFCTNTNCDAIDCSTLNVGRDKTTKDIKFIDTATTGSNSEPRKDFHYSKPEQKPVRTVDTTLDALQDILERTKRFRDKATMKYDLQDYQCRNAKCKNMDCDYRNAKTEVTLSDFNYSSLVLSELMTPEFMRMLMEIKKHTKTLEEQLMIMNRNMKIKKKAKEKFISSASPEKDIYYSKQHRDIITQEPEKENVCIQEPSQIDISYIKCVQDTPVKSESKFDSAEVKNRDITLQKSDKKRVHVKKVVKENKNREKEESANYKEQFVNCDTKSNTEMKSQIHHRPLKYSNKNNLSKIQNVLNQCVRSTSSFTFNHSNFRPIAASTPKRVNLLREKETFHDMPSCKENNSLSDGKLQMKQSKKTLLNELICCPLRKKEDIINLTNASDKGECSTSQEKTIVMVLLTRGVNNTHLKSKYKKLEFKNFRPKCIIHSCTMCDQGLMKCRSTRRKVQIPTVFRQLKSVTCKIERCGGSNKDSHNEFVEQPTKSPNVSDLLTTVCTQSSNLYITTATSISCITFNNRNDLENYSEEGISTGACILS